MKNKCSPKPPDTQANLVGAQRILLQTASLWTDLQAGLIDMIRDLLTFRLTWTRWCAEDSTILCHSGKICTPTWLTWSKTSWRSGSPGPGSVQRILLHCVTVERSAHRPNWHDPRLLEAQAHLDQVAWRGFYYSGALNRSIGRPDWQDPNFLVPRFGKWSSQSRTEYFKTFETYF